MLSFLNINFDSFFRYFLSVLRDTDTCSIAYVCQKTNRSFQPNKYLKYQIPKKKMTPQNSPRNLHTLTSKTEQAQNRKPSLSLYILLTILTIKIFIYISTKSLVYPQKQDTHLTPVYSWNMLKTFRQELS